MKKQNKYLDFEAMKKNVYPNGRQVKDNGDGTVSKGSLCVPKSEAIKRGWIKE